MNLLQLRHPNPVISIKFSPDGTKLLSVADDHTGYVWDVNSGSRLCSLPLLPSFVVWSPDGARILHGSYDNTARVWCTETGAELLTLRGHNQLVTGACFSPNGERIVTCSGLTVRVWGAFTGKELFSFNGHTEYITKVCYSPDGKRILTGSHDGSVKVWDAATGQELLALKGHTSQILSVAWSPDGKRILTNSGGYTDLGGRLPGEAKVWDSETGQEVYSIKDYKDGIFSVEFSPDGKRILTGSYNDNTAKLWDAETGTELLTLKGHTNEVISASFSSNSEHIMLVGEDGISRIYFTDSGSLAYSLDYGMPLIHLCLWQPHGRRAARTFLNSAIVYVDDVDMHPMAIAFKKAIAAGDPVAILAYKDWQQDVYG